MSWFLDLRLILIKEIKIIIMRNVMRKIFDNFITNKHYFLSVNISFLELRNFCFIPIYLNTLILDLNFYFIPNFSFYFFLSRKKWNSSIFELFWKKGEACMFEKRRSNLWLSKWFWQKNKNRILTKSILILSAIQNLKLIFKIFRIMS